MRTEVLCISVLRLRVGLTGCKNDLTPSPVVYSTDRSKAVALVLLLLFEALCSFVVPALLSFFFCMCCAASIVLTVFNSCLLFFLFY